MDPGGNIFAWLLREGKALTTKADEFLLFYCKQPPPPHLEENIYGYDWPGPHVILLEYFSPFRSYKANSAKQHCYQKKKGIFVRKAAMML